jgi:copper chaperone
MFVFEVKDMTCGHCSGTITRALKSTDNDAKVAIDLARHLVAVESANADRDELGAAIASAGYTPVLVTSATNDAPGNGGSCCGHCH